MLNPEPGNRTLPTLITLLVIGVLLMTFDIRSEGEGVAGVVRSGAQTVVSPLQEAASFVVSPVTDLIDSLSNVATMRAQNEALRQELADAQATIIANQADLARLRIFEQLWDLEATGSDIGRTVAEVIGRAGAFDGALIISKGTSSGINVGQPVLDNNGFVVGTVTAATPGTATVVPITIGPSGVGVAVGEQVGTVVPLINTNEMRLEITNAREPILNGARVVTSSASVRFPAGLPVGAVVGDAAPIADSITAQVVPYMNPDTVQLVQVLAWPPDPITAATEPLPDPATATTTTTTTVPTTSTTGGG